MKNRCAATDFEAQIVTALFPLLSVFCIRRAVCALTAFSALDVVKKGIESGLVTSVFYYMDYDRLDEAARNAYRMGMAAFGGIAPTYHIALLDKPTIVWDFHSLLLGIQMMFSFLLTDEKNPLRLCHNCQRAFLASRKDSLFCSPKCKRQFRERNKSADE